MSYLVVGIAVILIQIIDRISSSCYPLYQNRILFAPMLKHIRKSKRDTTGMQLVQNFEQLTLLSLVPTGKSSSPVVVRSCGDEIRRVAIDQISLAQPREIESVEIATGKGNIPFVQTSNESR